MVEHFSDIVSMAFDGAESIEFQTGQTPEGNYEYALISGIDRDTVDEKIDELSERGIEATTIEASDGLGVEAWA
jgi:hypothetical protein